MSRRLKILAKLKPDGKIECEVRLLESGSLVTTVVVTRAEYLESKKAALWANRKLEKPRYVFEADFDEEEQRPNVNTVGFSDKVDWKLS